MLIKTGRLELELITNPKHWGWTRGTTESHDGKRGWYITVACFRIEWYPLNGDEG